MDVYVWLSKMRNWDNGRRLMLVAVAAVGGRMEEELARKSSSSKVNSRPEAAPLSLSQTLRRIFDGRMSRSAKNNIYNSQLDLL